MYSWVRRKNEESKRDEHRGDLRDINKKKGKNWERHGSAVHQALATIDRHHDLNQASLPS
jgi:hypothetical protein